MVGVVLAPGDAEELREGHGAGLLQDWHLLRFSIVSVSPLVECVLLDISSYDSCSEMQMDDSDMSIGLSFRHHAHFKDSWLHRWRGCGKERRRWRCPSPRVDASSARHTGCRLVNRQAKSSRRKDGYLVA